MKDDLARQSQTQFKGHSETLKTLDSFISVVISFILVSALLSNSSTVSNLDYLVQRLRVGNKMLLKQIGSRSSWAVKSVIFSTRNMSTTGTNFGRLSGRVAIVTASTDGIGLAIAKRLAQDGAKVMISSRKEKNVQKALDTLHTTDGIPKDQLKGIVCHVGNAQDRTKLIEQTVAEFGGIDILVSNAAVNPTFGPALDCPEDAWDKIFDINVKVPFLLTREVKPHLLKSKNKPSLVYVTSIAGYQPFSVLGPYSISKTALLGLVKVMAQELGPENIRANGVAPGIIKTKFASALTSTDEISEKMLEMVPLGRFGEPHEIAGLVSFLVSDDASYVTGETYVAAGGQPSRL